MWQWFIHQFTGLLQTRNEGLQSVQARCTIKPLKGLSHERRYSIARTRIDGLMRFSLVLTVIASFSAALIFEGTNTNELRQVLLQGAVPLFALLWVLWAVYACGASRPVYDGLSQDYLRPRHTGLCGAIDPVLAGLLDTSEFALLLRRFLSQYAAASTDRPT